MKTGIDAEAKDPLGVMALVAKAKLGARNFLRRLWLGGYLIIVVDGQK